MAATEQQAIDLLIVGGGINGAGIARDAAGRGLSVMLVEKSDLAAATSSWSSKLIHGGLRYLEQYEFRLVRARAIGNAAGPMVKDVVDNVAGEKVRGGVRLVKGSHIIVPKVHSQGHAYILQNPDRRVIFVIPYESRFSLIGTTDVAVPD